jgi:hypothetical protein
VSGRAGAGATGRTGTGLLIDSDSEVRKIWAAAPYNCCLPHWQLLKLPAPPE